MTHQYKPGLLTAAAAVTTLLGTIGCVEEAGVRDSTDDRYTLPEPSAYAAPGVGGSATGVTGEPSGAGGVDLSPTARPGVWDGTRDAEVEQGRPTKSPYQNLPSGSVPQPQGGQPANAPAAQQPQNTPVR
jgi:hypothetical protein